MPPLGLFAHGKPDGPPRPVRLKVTTHNVAPQDLYCSSQFTVVKNGVERTISGARLKMVLNRSANTCDSIVAPGGLWQGSVTIKYLSDKGRIATSRRVGTFSVLDQATSSEGPGVLQIAATPTGAPATGPFAGTYLVLKLTYDPTIQGTPIVLCRASAWSGWKIPSFSYWDEF